MLDAVPLVLATKLIAPAWLIELLEVKVILPPLALSVIVPVCVIPVFDPAAVLFAVTDKSEPPETIVIAPSETIVDAVVADPVTLILLADIAPANDTAVLAFDVLSIVIEPLLAVRVPAEVPLIPGLVVDVVLVDVAVKLMLPVVDVNADVK